VSSESPRGISRRQFLLASAAAPAAALTGCQINPVTGKSQFMLVSEQEEIQMDKGSSPHQFSSDYGAMQDTHVNQYVTYVGQSLSRSTHRPKMPYNYRCVNASYVNAYTFPAGSMATTRGIMLALEDEAELAALLGHELGHVNARHTASRMSHGMLLGGVLAGAGLALGEENEELAQVVLGVGGLASGMLLAKYSRGDERQADQLGMDYMVRGGYNPQGMVGLMEELKKLHDKEPSALEQMFASHPPSNERYQTAVARISTQYGHAKNLPTNRQRYMDYTVAVRRQKDIILSIQRGNKALGQKQVPQAMQQYGTALRHGKDDYEANLRMARCLISQKKGAEAYRYANHARSVYAQEPLANQVCGLASVQTKQFDRALQDFSRYDTMLPGNPSITFFKGLSYEGMSNRQNAAQMYTAYLKKVNSGDMAKHAQKRLIEWGYLKAPTAGG